MDETKFIGEPITAEFDTLPVLEKKPGCPDRFVWGEERFIVAELLQEWHDYQRRGRMAMNMRPEHAERAAAHGSWGVGRAYFRVRTTAGRLFDIYYDRAPKGTAHRKGSWHLYQEIKRLRD